MNLCISVSIHWKKVTDASESLSTALLCSYGAIPHQCGGAAHEWLRSSSFLTVSMILLFQLPTKVCGHRWRVNQPVNQQLHFNAQLCLHYNLSSLFPAPLLIHSTIKSNQIINTHKRTFHIHINFLKNHPRKKDVLWRARQPLNNQHFSFYYTHMTSGPKRLALSGVLKSCFEYR